MRINKQNVKDEIIKLEEAKLNFYQQKYNEFLESSKLDNYDSIDSQSISIAEQSGELSTIFDSPMHEHQKALEIIKQIDFSQKDTVKPGSIVKIGNRKFVISIATESFNVDGEEYIGISSNSPMYQEIEGLTQNDKFEFRGKSLKIDEIQ